MKLSVVLATLALILPATTQPTLPTEFECHPDNGNCENSGSWASGTEYGCDGDNNVLIRFAYYGHVWGQFTYPLPDKPERFFYDGAPFWTVWYFDNNDSERGAEVDWRMGGPKQRYAGQNHLIYEVEVLCERHDSPRKPKGGTPE